MSENKDDDNKPAKVPKESPRAVSEESPRAVPEENPSAVPEASPSAAQEPSQPDTDPPASHTGQAAAQQPAPARRGFPVVATLALLLVLALAAGAVWVLMEAQRREAALESRLADLQGRHAELQDRQAEMESIAEREVMDAAEQQAQIRQFSSGLERDLRDDLREGLSRLDPQLAEQSSRLRELEEQLERTEAQVTAQGEEIARYNAVDRESWLLAEVEYLLRLANQRLIMTGDVESAQALLRNADGILKQVDDVRLHATRRAVAADLAALRAVPRLDTEGLYVRLSALTEEAEALSIFQLPEAEQRLEPAPADSWKTRLAQGYRAALRKLSDYIIIRRRETPMQALMDPQWEGLVRQNLRMLLEQSQVALLSGNARLYRESLQRARHWVDQFSESDAQSAVAMNEELEQLAGETITVELPDISRSLRALESAIEQRRRDAEAEGDS